MCFSTFLFKSQSKLFHMTSWQTLFKFFLPYCRIYLLPMFTSQHDRKTSSHTIYRWLSPSQGAETDTAIENTYRKTVTTTAWQRNPLPIHYRWTVCMGTGHYLFYRYVQSLAHTYVDSQPLEILIRTQHMCCSPQIWSYSCSNIILQTAKICQKGGPS